MDDFDRLGNSGFALKLNGSCVTLYRIVVSKAGTVQSGVKVSHIPNYLHEYLAALENHVKLVENVVHVSLINHVNLLVRVSVQKRNLVALVVLLVNVLESTNYTSV